MVSDEQQARVDALIARQRIIRSEYSALWKDRDHNYWFPALAEIERENSK